MKAASALVSSPARQRGRRQRSETDAEALTREDGLGQLRADLGHNQIRSDIPIRACRRRTRQMSDVPRRSRAR